MSHDKVFARKPNGEPLIGSDLAYHVENAKFVSFLEVKAIELGIPVVDDTVNEVSQDDRGITALHLASGQTVSADLYVDCTGFRSVLLGKALEEPFIDFKSTLWCDRAVAGGWERSADEPIKPYTTAETMDAGWCWQIEHERLVNRGYVYSSAFISDEDAEREFRAKNPKVQSTRIIRFRPGRYRNGWVKNVIAIGLSCGFVEPLEATSLAFICDQCKLLINVLEESDRREPTRHLVDLYNRFLGGGMEFIRGFLGVHYKYNTRLDTPFWRECREKVEVGAVAEAMVDYYQHNGPAIWGSNLVLGQHDTFGVDGYLCMLVGQQVPHRNPYQPADRERKIWESHRGQNRAWAQAGYSVPEALARIHSPTWQWDPDFYRNMFQAFR
jgi:tryptophan 7-halogenase